MYFSKLLLYMNIPPVLHYGTNAICSDIPRGTFLLALMFYKAFYVRSDYLMLNLDGCFWLSDLFL